MKKKSCLITFLVLLITAHSPLRGGLLLNEVSAGGSIDWIELKLTPDTDCLEISQLFATMYYGTNEKISDSPVTLYGSDRPETLWDDRFAVIYFSSSGTSDETDTAGDLNNNSIREIYCNNYGLWNTDCCVAIDHDDDPSNNGIIDFMAFSNRDGSINSTIASYINYAITYRMWNECASVNLQECCFDTGLNGMKSWQTLSRTGSADTESVTDFVLTSYATPGRENIVSAPGGRGILKPVKSRLVHNYGNTTGKIELPVFLYRRASLRVRIFNSAGMNVYTGPLITDASPGFLAISICEKDIRGRILTGLYPVSIEAVDLSDGSTGSLRITLIMVR